MLVIEVFYGKGGRAIRVCARSLWKRFQEHFASHERSFESIMYFWWILGEQLDGVEKRAMRIVGAPCESTDSGMGGKYSIFRLHRLLSNTRYLLSFKKCSTVQRFFVVVLG